jgi:tetratricopeptide (TPR) repeat protein
MNEIGAVWKPGVHKGDTVRTEFILPIKFKLEEAPDYTFVEGDSVYTNFDQAVEYIGGNEAFAKYISDNLKYPEFGNDSCMIGVMDMEALIQPNTVVKVHNIIDYNNLGIDFQFEAISLLTSSMGNWKPAVLQGRDVPSTFPVRLVFKPEAEACNQTISNFDKAELLMAEATVLIEQEKKEEGLAKMGEAIELFPKNAYYLYTRGMIYMNDNKMAEACEDLTRAKETLLTSWFDNLVPIICAQAAVKTTE